MNLLFSMSLAGSLVFLVYLILRPMTVRYFSSAWRYRLLKLVLIFFLLPYQYFKYHYYDVFCNIFFDRQYQSPQFLAGFGSYDLNKLILIDSESNYLLKNGKMIFSALAVWSIVVISFVVYQVIKYIFGKKELQRISNVPDPGPYAILDQCRKHAHFQKKVELFSCSYINTPFTIGVFSPRIILPNTLNEEKSFQMAISHELTHVKNHDILIKLLTLLVMALHWYNPLTYLLYWEICRVPEYVCDEKVTQDMTQEEKEKYKFLIIELAQESSQTNKLFANTLSSNYKMIKERITLMDKSIISPKCMHIVSFALAVLLLVMSPLPVLAYSPMVRGTSENPDSDFDFDGELYYILNQEDVYAFCMDDSFLELGADYDIFINSDGVASIIYDTTPPAERSSCTHNWQDGYVQRHEKNSDGSCIINIYKAQICSKCSAYKVGVLYNSLQYLVCPH